MALNPVHFNTKYNPDIKGGFGGARGDRSHAFWQLTDRDGAALPSRRADDSMGGQTKTIYQENKQFT